MTKLMPVKETVEVQWSWSQSTHVSTKLNCPNLSIDKSNIWTQPDTSYLVGITSFGHKCAEKGFPGITFILLK